MLINDNKTTMKHSLLLILFLNFTLLQADISLSYLREYTDLPYIGEGYLYPFPEECSKILNSFADYASNFTKCSILHARPIRICERCVEQYVQVDNTYQELLNTTVNGTSCRSVFISHDRLDAVLESYKSISTLWTKGHCDGCFEWTGPEIHLSNNTVKFIKMFNDTTDCIVNNINQFGNNSDEVCEKCMQSYLQLDEFYKSMSTDGIGVDNVCMDMVDSMNATRSIWSKSLNCCKLRRSPEIVFLCCTGIISALPILYYLAVRFCGPIRDLPKVLRQSRFKQSILRHVDGSIN